MDKSRRTEAMGPTGKAAFRVDARAFRSRPLERLLDETLARAFGGRFSPGMSPVTCTTDSCTMLKPPPAPGQ